MKDPGQIAYEAWAAAMRWPVPWSTDTSSHSWVAAEDAIRADERAKHEAQVAALREALALFTCDCAPKIECADPSYCRNSIARAALEEK